MFIVTQTVLQWEQSALVGAEMSLKTQDCRHGYTLIQQEPLIYSVFLQKVCMCNFEIDAETIGYFDANT